MHQPAPYQSHRNAKSIQVVHIHSDSCWLLLVTHSAQRIFVNRIIILMNFEMCMIDWSEVGGRSSKESVAAIFPGIVRVYVFTISNHNNTIAKQKLTAFSNGAHSIPSTSIRSMWSYLPYLRIKTLWNFCTYAYADVWQKFTNCKKIELLFCAATNIYPDSIPFSPLPCHTSNQLYVRRLAMVVLVLMLAVAENEVSIRQGEKIMFFVFSAIFKIY